MGNGPQELPKVLQEVSGPNRRLVPVTGRAQYFHPPHVSSVSGPKVPEQLQRAGSQKSMVKFARDPLLLKSCHAASPRRTCLALGWLGNCFFAGSLTNCLR